MQGLIGNELGVDLSALGSCVCLEQGNYVFLAKTSWSNSVCLKLNSKKKKINKTKLIALSPEFAPLPTLS